MLKNLSLIMAFSISSLTASANCDIDANLVNRVCSPDYFVPKNSKQLTEYLQYGKFKDGKLLNLELNFDIKDKEINIATNCDVRVSRGVSFRSLLSGICIKGASVYFKGENQLYSDKKSPIFIGSGKSITLRRSFLQTKGEITLASKFFNPFDGEILISKDSMLKSDKIKILTPSNLIINKESSLNSSDIVLSGGNCEIGNYDDRENDDDRDHERSCKKFSPNFQYTGNCATNPLPTNIKIASATDSKDSLSVSYSLESRPTNAAVRWRFDQEAVNVGRSANKIFLFPGRHLIESIVVDQSGYFRKIGIYQNVSPNKFNKGQMAIFQFSGLKRSPSKVTALMGLKKFTLTKSDHDSELYSGEIPADTAGNKLITVPEFGYRGSLNLVALPIINNPDSYISQNVDQLNILLDSSNSTNQSYQNAKTSIRNLLEELKEKLSVLSSADKQKVAEYLQANIFADIEGVTSFKQIKERPTTLFGILIMSAYADDLSNFINSSIQGMRALVLVSPKLLGAAFFAIGGFTLFSKNITGIWWNVAGLISAAAGIALLTSRASAAQDEINDVHNVDSDSLYLRLPSQINSGEVSSFSIWGQAVPLDSIAPASPLITQAINAKNNANFELGKINSQLGSVNSTLSLLGYSSQIEPLPLLSFPQTRFKTILSPNYVTSVQIISSDEGNASVSSYFVDGNNLNIKFISPKTQKAVLRVTYYNQDFGIEKNIDTEIQIQNPLKAYILFTKNYLDASFDSTDPENPDIEGLTYTWNLGDGKIIETTSKTFSHHYQNPGPYIVTLTVSDSKGNSDSASVSLYMTPREISFFIKVSVHGTYLYTDTTVGWRDIANDKNYPDVKLPPSSVSIETLMNDPYIRLKPRDILILESVGAHQASVPPSTDTDSTLAGVFYGNGGFIYPDTTFEEISTDSIPFVGPFRSQNTCNQGHPTDIPQDFYIPSQPAKVRVPAGAKELQLTVDDCYFADNSDPNNDFGILVKFTIVREFSDQ